MRESVWCLAIGLALLAALPAGAEVVKGVLSVNGVEMS